jgi:PPOX class probable F420-dependent enzyme
MRVILPAPGATRKAEKMVAVPDNYLDLVTQKKAFADLATLMPDGSPQVTPVWIDYQGGMIRMNTAKGRVKARNLQPGARVALSIIDPDNPYRYIQIRGRVASAGEDGADTHIDSLAKKYLGKDKYPFRRPGEIRIMYEIEPLAVSGMG